MGPFAASKIGLKTPGEHRESGYTIINMRGILASLALLALIPPPAWASGGATAAPAQSPRFAGAVAYFTPVGLDWGKALHVGPALKGLSALTQGLNLGNFAPANPSERAALAPLVAQLALQGLTPDVFRKLDPEKKAEALNQAAEAARAQLRHEAGVLNDQIKGLLAQAEAGAAKAEDLNEALAAYKRLGFYNRYLEQAENDAVVHNGRAVRQAIGRITETALEAMLAAPQLSPADMTSLGGVTAADDRANLQLTPYTPYAGLRLLADRLAEPVKGSQELAARQSDIAALAQISLAETSFQIQNAVASLLQQELGRKGVTKAYALKVNQALELVAKDSPYGDVKARAARGLLASPALGDGVQRAASVAVDAASKSFMQWVKQAAEKTAENAGKKDKELIAASVASIDQALAALAQAQAPPSPPAQSPGDGAAADVTGKPADAQPAPAPHPQRGPVLRFVRDHPLFTAFVAFILAAALYGLLSGRFDNPPPVRPPAQPPAVEQPAPVQPPVSPSLDIMRPNSPAENAAGQEATRRILEGRAGELRDD